jgi:hypothetical protein
VIYATFSQLISPINSDLIEIDVVPYSFTVGAGAMDMYNVSYTKKVGKTIKGFAVSTNNMSAHVFIGVDSYDDANQQIKYGARNFWSSALTVSGDFLVFY